jgi:hypothetical protein
MCRTLGLLVVLVVLSGACSARADPVAPSGPPPTKASRAEPYRLDRHHGLHAVRMLRPRGFERVLTCPRRQHKGCRREGTAATRWLVGSQAHGARLPRGNGLVESVRNVVTAWPSAAFARTYADELARQLRRYRGEYDVPMKETGPHTYIPGERGRGELHRVSLLGWRGVALRKVFHYVFYACRSSLSGLVVGPPSARVPGARFVLRKGRYVLDLEWVARSQASDRRLSRLPARLVRALR